MNYTDVNEKNRRIWLRKILSAVPEGARILDAGAGELQNRPLCAHLQYVSQDFCEYSGEGDGKGLQTGNWDTSSIDIVCDITAISEPDASFDAILCSEVLEHVPDPTKALDEFARLLKPSGILILTAPFGSLVHFAPYHYSSGFSRYWYEYHLNQRGLSISELTPNGDWFSFFYQELRRFGSMAKNYGDWHWPFAYVLGMFGSLYFKFKSGKQADDLACFGWHCIAVKS